MSTGRSTATRDQHRRAIARTKPPCGICGGDIDYSLRTPDPLSFEVDHVIAIVNGGTDTLDNKQASHRRCNRAKSGKTGTPDVVLTGTPRTYVTARQW